MKTVNKIKEKKNNKLKKPKIKAKKEKVIIVAQEIKFARLLSGNEKKTRDRVLKTLKKWLLNCFEKGYDPRGLEKMLTHLGSHDQCVLIAEELDLVPTENMCIIHPRLMTITADSGHFLRFKCRKEFKEDDFIRVWKGLFYAVWMSDKPLVQEELCETIAGILDLFPPSKVTDAFLMAKAGFKVLATEWYGIDYHRMDKFMMLVRRYLRGSLRCLQRSDWSQEACQQYTDMLSGTDGILSTKTPLYARNASSMLLHFVDCFLEELAKVSNGSIPDSSMTVLLRPFCRYMSLGTNLALSLQCRRLLTALLRQTDTGLEYQMKTKAWDRMGCPRGGPDALELVSDDDDDEQLEGSDDEEEVQNGSKPLDPRAGRVDVELASLPVPAADIALMLKELLASTSSKAFKRTQICIRHFEKLSKCEYPLVVADVLAAPPRPRPRRPRAARSLQRLERTLVLSADELALRGLSRKHRKRLLAKSRAGFSIIDDVRPADDTSAATNGNWKIESTQPAEKKAKKHKLDSSNKENEHKNKNNKKPKLANKQTDKESSPKVNTEKKNHKKDSKDSKENKSEKETSISNKIKKKQKHLNEVIEKALVSKEKVDAKPNDKQNMNKDTKKEKVLSKLDKNKKQTDAIQTDKATTDKLVKENKNESSEKKDVKIVEKKVALNKHNNKKLSPTVVVNKVKYYQKKTTEKRDFTQKKDSYETPKKVKFVLKNNCMQGPVDYYKSVRQSPSIPFDSSKQPSKTNLKPSTPSPINPFFKKKLKLKNN